MWVILSALVDKKATFKCFRESFVLVRVLNNKHTDIMSMTVRTKSLDFKKVTLTDFISSLGQNKDNRFTDLQKRCLRDLSRF